MRITRAAPFPCSGGCGGLITDGTDSFGGVHCDYCAAPLAARAMRQRRRAEREYLAAANNGVDVDTLAAFGRAEDALAFNGVTVLADDARLIAAWRQRQRAARAADAAAMRAVLAG